MQKNSLRWLLSSGTSLLLLICIFLCACGDNSGAITSQNPTVTNGTPLIVTVSTTARNVQVPNFATIGGLKEITLDPIVKNNISLGYTSFEVEVFASKDERPQVAAQVNALLDKLNYKANQPDADYGFIQGNCKSSPGLADVQYTLADIGDKKPYVNEISPSPYDVAYKNYYAQFKGYKTQLIAVMTKSNNCQRITPLPIPTDTPVLTPRPITQHP